MARAGRDRAGAGRRRRRVRADWSQPRPVGRLRRAQLAWWRSASRAPRRSQPGTTIASSGSGRTSRRDRLRGLGGSRRRRRPPGPAQRLDRGVPTDPQPVLATSASGYAALAWTRDKQARVAVRPPGGAFGAPVAIPSSDVVGQVAVGIDERRRRDGPVERVRGRRARAPCERRRWRRATRPRRRRRSAGRERRGVALAVDGRGDALAAWGTSVSTAQGGAAPRRRRLRRAHDLRRPRRGRLRWRAPRSIPTPARRSRSLRRGYAPLPVRRRRARAGDAGRRLGRTAVAGPERQRPPAHARGEQRRGARRAVGHPARLLPRPSGRGAHRARRPRAAPSAWSPKSVEPPLRPLSYATTETANDAVLTGGGETLALWSGRRRGSDHPPALRHRGSRADRAVAGRRVQRGRRRHRRGAGAQAAALFLQRRGLWIAYRAAGTAARPRPPRICSLIWASANSADARPRARAGLVDSLRPHLQADRAPDRRAAPRDDRRTGGSAHAPPATSGSGCSAAGARGAYPQGAIA